MRSQIEQFTSEVRICLNEREKNVLSLSVVLTSLDEIEYLIYLQLFRNETGSVSDLKIAGPRLKYR